MLSMSQNGFVFFVAKWQKSSTKKKKKHQWQTNFFNYFFCVTQLSIIQEFYDLLVYVGGMW
jgi:hypothetical protein